MLENIISKIFLEHQYILESTSVSEFDKEIFSSIARRKAFRKNFVFPLLLLSKALKNHCCKNIIILIDNPNFHKIYPQQDVREYSSVYIHLNGILGI